MNEVGSKLIFTKEITAELISAFSLLTGDFNPMHTGEDFSGKNSIADKLGIGEGMRIAHGMLYASLICFPLWKLGGNGAIFGELGKLRFLKPVKVGDTVSIELEVKKREGRRLILCVKYKNQTDEDIIGPTEAALFVLGEDH